MVVEILFSEVCNLYGDGQNIQYLQASLPDAQFVFTTLMDTPYFTENTPDLIYIGAMSESIQRRVIEKLIPFKARILELVEGGTPILATGNAGEIFCNRLNYITEQIFIDGLDIFDITVTVNLFDRYHAKTLCQMDDLSLVGFRAQFSFWYGKNENCYFAKVLRGVGIHKTSKLEGLRKNNLICTQLIGPILPLNPLFCEYLLQLAGSHAPAAYRDAAMRAYQQRLQEFTDPTTQF